ncbi:MAG TPA: xanthine dehydrogenase family protein molybdopterin-binding subunit [Candidatus Marinimicrobia bacterium]|jgi:carbon-monoxide dehydrogenase large subunit|nr:xanthine dehydrogenase family protein molybdopterin-binding subunit [Candidatus Neomarinimicrobiota bacterium]MDP7120737.1 xanthine dehydrogenase family protein molybdopterin-binding subunit [Candidatus Neomarinimicrobiota bacterium]MDP7484405.1 xanthine dehydrogenase family protein molybdopterin-binding subunit [Candidatus Neomarinimicrobiota bacterium]MDP7715823.1 xanthine dehydrogenase family protein molybdopterin-binding subunit [Candidatus Neomarinimicrobiota bacterium]HJL84750.1 xanthi|tara:strand:+ start:1963 stop:4332 length:2370 start_codon:yes stop_codon:yes gene_type:complete
MGELIGKSVKRVEDNRFIKGEGQYTDDFNVKNQTYAVYVRSPHAHATINSVDVSKAEAMDGVLKVFTGQDIADAGIVGSIAGWQVDFKNGDTMKEPPHPIMVADKVRHVGDAVALVVAEDRFTAKDASELVKVDYEVLDAVVDPKAATEDGAPLVHDDVPNNTIYDFELGNKDETDAAFENADKVIELSYHNQKLVPNAMEPRAALAQYDANEEKYTLYTTSQNPHLARLVIGAFVLSIPEHKLRVISPDVGGGFGSKIFVYNDECGVLWASKQLGRPVKWTADRSEAFITDCHGRDHMTDAKMALDKDGNITGLRTKTYASMGAYLSNFSTCVPTYLHATLMQGLYKTPAVHVDVTAVVTHTVPVDAYRGAGRPEATYSIERLVETAAREIGMDPAEFRRKNFIPPFDGVDEPGFQTNVALQYDSGNYEGVLDKALEVADYESLKKERDKAKADGRLMGIGFSTYIEACGIAPSAVVGSLGARVGLYDAASIRVAPTGKVTVHSGAHAHGQGHETTFAQVVADAFGIGMEDVNVVHGDTENVPFGMGTYGSRSLSVCGSAIMKSVDKIKEKGARIAAHKLECSPDDLEFADGSWTVKGTDKSVGFGDVALTAYVPHDYPEGEEPGLDFASFYDPVNFTYPFGAHICVVEVDKDTGEVKVVKYVAVDDVGNVINPMIVDGQVHGGVAQGIGQALFEGAVYDDSGQLLTGSMLDYCMPRADNFPMFETDRTVTPCPHNPLGVKGVGETGTIGSTPAVVNAVVDALSDYGVKDLQMPLTPERVWKAMQNGN